MSNDYNDDYEDLPPVEEESDDFKNFDPAKYLANRRQTGSRRDLAQDDYDREELAPRGRSSRRSRRREALGDSDMGGGGIDGEGIPVGMSAGILGSLISPENSRMLANLLGGAAPLVRSILPAIGCVLLALCALVCGAGYIVISTLTKR
jgi:hypothetical protein